MLTVVPYHQLHRVAQERRLRRIDVTCPACGYSLVGLSECRCPECGEQFTIEQLLIENDVVLSESDEATERRSDEGRPLPPLDAVADGSA